MLQAQILRCRGPLACYVCPLLGTLSVSCLAAEFSLSCHLAQCLAPGGLDERLLSWTVTVYVSQLWQSQHSALHFIQPLCIFLYTHFTSVLRALCSEECHTGGELQDSGHAKPLRDVTYLLSSHVTSAECISYGFGNFPVLLAEVVIHLLHVRDLSCLVTHDTAGA